jgi:hypothetical protein
LNIFEPRIFNFIILTLYIMNAVWWAGHRRWADVSYWLCAFGITATVTWGYKH